MTSLTLPTRYLQALVFLASLTFGWQLYAETYISDKLLRQNLEWETRQKYESMTQLRMHIVVITHDDSKQEETIRQVSNVFQEKHRGKFSQGQFSLTNTKYYPTNKGKIVKPNVLVAIGHFKRPLHIYKEYLREAGIDAHLLPASVLSNVKYEFEVDETKWLSL